MTSFIAPREKLFGHLDRVAEIRERRATSAPVNVEIDLSNRCSLGCEWCHFSFTHTRGPLANKVPKPPDSVPGGDLMDTALAFSIIRQLAEAGVRSLTFTGGGEPTLHPDFDDIVEFASLFDLALGIYTHGGHIDEDRALLLKQAMTFVYVSLDAADRDDYKRAKGVDRFNRACDGIRLLVAADGPATIGVGYLVTESNYKKVTEAARLVDELGADYLQCRPTIRFTHEHPDVPSENTSWVSDAIRELNKARYALPNVDADTDRFRMYQNWQGHGYDTCWWTTLQSCITPNGKVWACVNKREHAAAEIGDLSAETFATVWARHMALPVESDCRVMCRGHIPNLALDELVPVMPHGAFI